MKRHVNSGLFCAGFLTVVFPFVPTDLISAQLASQPTASTSFVIDESGILYGWGRNDLGQVGNGTLSVEPPYISEAYGIMPPAGATGWKRVSGGWGHTLAIADNDQLYAWGFNGHGRLGTGRFTNETMPTPVALPVGVTAWTQVAAGSGHSLAIGSDGKIYAWGANDWGQLGIATAGAAGTDVPVEVVLPEEPGGWKSIGAGSAHSLALSHNGHVYFWGRNIARVSSEGPDILTNQSPTRMVRPEGATTWNAIGAGYNHSFAIADDGKLYAWGNNQGGQLGNASFRGTNAPHPVAGVGTNVQWVAAAGGVNSSIGLDVAGNAYVWGAISNNLIVIEPRRVAPAYCLAGWKAVTAGYRHYLAIGSDCRLFGWGANDYAQVNSSARVSSQEAPQWIHWIKRVCSQIVNTPPGVGTGTDALEYSAPADITITASVSDCEANVSEVSFYEGTNLLSVASVQMTNGQNHSVSFVWPNVTAGVYSFWTTATDEGGARATSSPVRVVVSNFTNGISEIRLTTNGFELADALLAWNCGGILLNDVAVSAQATESAASIGVFETTAPLSTAYGQTGPGVIISTGDAGGYKTGPNRSSASSYPYGVAARVWQEALLDPISTGTGTNNFRHYDVTEFSLHFHVLPGYDRLAFKLVFGTEEYPEFVNSAFADVLGIFLNGTNIALVEGSPINPNHLSMTGVTGTELDGLLAPGGDPLIMISAPVTPGSSSNVLTFILADRSDLVLDSTVYLSELRALRIGEEPSGAHLLVAIAAMGDSLRLKVSEVPCGLIAIDGSSDLIHWTALSTNAPQGGAVETNVPINAAAAFFRARRIR